MVPLPDASTPIRRMISSYPRPKPAPCAYRAAMVSFLRFGAPCGAPHLDGGFEPVDNKITPGEIVVMAGAAVCLIFSFLPFYKLDAPAGFSDDNTSAWGEGLFPVATLIILFAVAAGVIVALTKFANVNIGGFLGFGYNQLLLALTFFAAILALAFLIVDKDPVDFGFGYFLVLIGSLGSVVGAVLMMNEAGSRPGTPPPPTA